MKKPNYDDAAITVAKQTAALARKLTKPFVVTIHVPEWARQHAERDAKAAGIKLEYLYSLILSGPWGLDSFDMDELLGNYRDDMEIED